jgi:hypothetical protein
MRIIILGLGLLLCFIGWMDETFLQSKQLEGAAVAILVEDQPAKIDEAKLALANKITKKARVIARSSATLFATCACVLILGIGFEVYKNAEEQRDGLERA